MTARRVIARLLAWISALAASAGFAGACVERTVLDPGLTAEIAPALLRSGPVHDQLTAQIARQLVATTRSSPAPLDQTAARRAAEHALTDPLFVSAFDAALREFHSEVIGDGPAGAAPQFDASGVARALQRSLARDVPALASAHAPKLDLDVVLKAGALKRVAGAVAFVRAATPVAVVVAVLVAALALVVDPQPWKSLRRLGHRTALLTLLPLLGAALAPAAVRGLAPSSATSLQMSLADAVVPRILPVAMFAALCAIGLWAMALVWQELHHEGARSALSSLFRLGHSRAPAAAQHDRADLRLAFTAADRTRPGAAERAADPHTRWL